MLNALKQRGDLGGPLLKGLLTLLDQLELPPVQETHEEEFLARPEIELEVFLLHPVTYREQLNHQL